MPRKKNGIKKVIKRDLRFSYPLIILLVLIGLEIAAIIYFLRVPLSGLLQFTVNLRPESVQDYISDFGLWAPLIFLLLQTLQVVVSPIPGHVVTMAGGIMFGTLNGTLLSILGSFFGSLMAFKLSQKFGRTIIEKLSGKQDFNFYDEFFQEKGPYAVFLLRLMPFMSFAIVSYGMGLTKISFKDYAFATLLGMIPGTLIFSYFGANYAINPIFLIVSSLLIVVVLLALPAIKGYLMTKNKSKRKIKKSV